MALAGRKFQDDNIRVSWTVSGGFQGSVFYETKLFTSENQMKKMRFSILLLGTTFLMNSCSQPAADQEAAAAVSPGNAVAAESVPPPSEGAGGWMDGMPEIIPPFSYGTFSSQSYKFESANGTIYSLYYE